MKRRMLFLVLLVWPAVAAEPLAKNVILFLGDACGIATLNAASIYKHGAPQKLFIQSMPHIGLMDTSSASEWVTDSAAGMTAIVTGQKTQNGVISQSASAVRGEKDGQPLKTILEHAEERGLSTGVVSNSSIASATPAACYAQVNDRDKVGEIFAQALKPRFGDGVDVIIGPGREEILEMTAELMDVSAFLRGQGRGPYDSLDTVPSGAQRPVVLLAGGNFDLGRATQKAIEILSQNPKGFFLMVESDLHTEELVRGLQRTVALDDIIRQTVAQTNPKDTLVIFTADHSFDLRIHDGEKGEPLLGEITDPEFGDDIDSIRMENVRRDDDHTAEEVLVAAQGPGAGRIRGFFSNTDLFHIMMAAYGWEDPPASNGNKATGQ